MANNNYKIATNILVSDIIATGGSTNTSSYTGFPSYNTANLSFQRHDVSFGYQVNGTDLSNTIEAFYREYIGGGPTNTGSAQNDNQPNNSSFYAYYAYGNTISASDTIPSWCTKIKVIVIGAGGGGGGGGTNATNRGGSGGGGGSGGLAAATISVSPGQVYDISLGGCGRGGFYEKDPDANGYNANNPVSIITKFAVGGAGLLQANCGGAGDGGERATGNNNTSQTATGGTATISGNGLISSFTSTGSEGNAGNNSNPGESAGITNSANLPVLNTNQGDAPNDRQIDQDNELPGIGQGGWGGVNANNSNGYGGQCGGRSLVRVYFIR